MDTLVMILMVLSVISPALGMGIIFIDKPNPITKLPVKVRVIFMVVMSIFNGLMIHFFLADLMVWSGLGWSIVYTFFAIVGITHSYVSVILLRTSR